jgi:hypothetical protein
MTTTTEGASANDEPPRSEAIRRRRNPEPHPASLWRAARKETTSPAPAPPKKQTGRGSAGDGFPPLARLLAQRRFPVSLKAFKKAARTRLRRIRFIRLSRAAWGAPDAHLQTTLNLFDQPGSSSAAAPGMSNDSRAVRSHHQPSENSVSPGL